MNKIKWCMYIILPIIISIFEIKAGLWYYDYLNRPFSIKIGNDTIEVIDCEFYVTYEAGYEPEYSEEELFCFDHTMQEIINKAKETNNIDYILYIKKARDYNYEKLKKLK